MAGKSGFFRVVLITNLLAFAAKSMAQEIADVSIPPAPVSARHNLAGICTSRLSPGRLRLWNSIREIVFAKDSSGRLLHPRLCELWQSVDQSGHTVFIELIMESKRNSCQAGEYLVEKLDPSGRRHVISIRLYIPTIDRAYADKRAPRDAARFAPLSGLAKKARYAEVLGHELAHVAKLFEDPDYMRLDRELDRELSAFRAKSTRFNEQATDQATVAQRERIRLLVSESEKPVVAAEAVVWRELLKIRGAKPGPK